MYKKQPGEVIHDYNPSHWEAEVEGSWFQVKKGETVSKKLN
jgi:hypothetical protein